MWVAFVRVGGELFRCETLFDSLDETNSIRYVTEDQHALAGVEQGVVMRQALLVPYFVERVEDTDAGL